MQPREVIIRSGSRAIAGRLPGLPVVKVSCPEESRTKSKSTLLERMMEDTALNGLRYPSARVRTLDQGYQEHGLGLLLDLSGVDHAQHDERVYRDGVCSTSFQSRKI